VYSNVSSLNSDGTEYLSQVNESFNGTKIFFDTDGEFEIHFIDKKSFTYEYEWDSKTEELYITFAGKGTDHQHIKFLQYYEFRCSLMSESTLKLDFFTPGSSYGKGDDVRPEFSMFFKVK
jgi:hypothetical protein